MGGSLPQLALPSANCHKHREGESSRSHDHSSELQPMCVEKISQVPLDQWTKSSRGADRPLFFLAPSSRPAGILEQFPEEEMKEHQLTNAVHTSSHP